MSREGKGEAATPPVGVREVAAVAALVVFFLVSQLVALLLRRPFRASGVDQAFANPADPFNGLWLLGTVVAFTVLILYIARKKRATLIQALILGSVGLTLVYVFFPLLDMVPTPLFDGRPVTLLGATFSFNPAVAVALVPAAVLTLLLKKYPEWYIVDAVGVGVSAGTIAIFGSSFTPLTYLVVLVAFAVYDYVSVYKTKHMLSLADSVLDLRLPIMLVVPKTLDYSFLEERAGVRARAEGRGPQKPRDAMFIGLGDVVIPSIFGLAALPFGAAASFGAFAGIELGLLVLMWFVLKGKPHAGLPTLNAGALLGFLVGLYLDTGSLRFW